MKKICLKVSQGNLSFENPILLAGGCASFGEPFQGIFDLRSVGALITKAITPLPRGGNPPPRIAETPSGMINSIGLQNPGVEYFARALLPNLREQGVTVIVNVAGFSEKDFEEVLIRLKDEPGIYAFELDLSCPNVQDGLIFATDPLLFGRLLERLRPITSLPLIAKLSPAAGDLVPYGKIAFGAGLEGITVSNTWPAMAIDYRTGKTKTKTLTGGLSGPAIKPLTVERVYRCAQAIPGYPILASGGATCAEDVIEFIRAGALAVQLGTVLFLDPESPKKILERLPQILDEVGVSSINELRGKVYPP